MRARAAVGLVALLVGCTKGDAPTDADRNDVMFALSASVTGGSSLRITVSYLDQDTISVPLLNERVTVPTGTQSLPLTIDLTRCLADPRHTPAGPECTLVAGVALIQNGTVIDSVTVGPVTATPGQVVHATTSLTPIGHIDVAPASATIPVGSTTQLYDTVFSPTDAVLSGVSVTWTSRAPAIATVDTSGLVTGVTAGSTWIVASAGNQQDSSAITVTSVSNGQIIFPGLPNNAVTFSAPQNGTLPAAAYVPVASATDTVVVNNLVATITPSSATAWLVANVSDSSFGGQKVAPRPGGLKLRVQQSGSGVTTPATLDVHPTTTALTPGTYNATVTVTGSGGASGSIQITYTVSTPPAALVLSPDTLTFNVYGSGASTGSVQTVTGSATGLTVTGYTWSPAATGYLTSNLTGGSTFSVNVNTTTLPLGPLTATVTVQDAAGATATLYVNVSVWATFTKVVTGGAYSCGITTATTVYCWGDNTYGQLGIGQSGGQFSTPQLALIPNSGIDANAVVDISAGYLHVCAIESNNAVYCWGYNNYGQVGNGTASSVLVPTPTLVPNYTATQVVTGLFHTCAVGAPAVAPYGAAVSCWGYNGYGQFGNGTTTNSSSPVAIGQTFASLSSGAYFMCGIPDTDASSVYCWGDNTYGQLGIDSTNATYTSPRAVVGSFKAVSAGGFSICLIDGSSNVWCAGDNFYGQLGTGSFESGYSYAPVELTGLQADSIDGGYEHMCALTTTTAADCWGFDSAGALGIGQINDSIATPTAVTGLTFASVAPSSAGYHTCGITTHNALFCWGYGAYGQLGNGSTSNFGTAQEVVGQPAPSNVTPSKVVKKPTVTARRPART
jgi:alpha-tubulin suppressor-like RCC1 family protein